MDDKECAQRVEAAYWAGYQVGEGERMALAGANTDLRSDKRELLGLVNKLREQIVQIQDS